MEFRLRGSVQSRDQRGSSVGLDTQYHPPLLVRAGFVDENQLRIPTCCELIELVVALKDLLVHSGNSGIEGLAGVLPLERQYARELECFRPVVDVVDVLKFEAGSNHDGTGLLRRREKKGVARSRCGSTALRGGSGTGGSQPSTPQKRDDQHHGYPNRPIHPSQPPT